MVQGEKGSEIKKQIVLTLALSLARFAFRLEILSQPPQSGERNAE